MPRERHDVDRAALVRAAEKAYSALVVVEDAAWDVDVDAAAELVEACAAMERAVEKLRGGASA